jgi:hypothetical protein
MVCNTPTFYLFSSILISGSFKCYLDSSSSFDMRLHSSRDYHHYSISTSTRHQPPSSFSATIRETDAPPPFLADIGSDSVLTRRDLVKVALCVVKCADIGGGYVIHNSVHINSSSTSYLL